MKDVTYDNFAQLLRISVPGFDRVYDEHVADNDGVLPHVLIGDLVRFLYREVESHGTKGASLEEAMTLLECGMGSQDHRVQELVAVSFLENLDPSNPGFSVIRSLFGPKLKEQYRKYEGDIRT